MNVIKWADRFSTSVFKMLKANFELGNLLAAINEIEITNKFVRDLAILSSLQESDFSAFRIWHSKSESTNGNDIEIIIEVSSGKFVLFPCQCKRVFFKNDRSYYNKLWYSTDKHGFQIENLLNYAKRTNGIPVYMLYNFVNNIETSEKNGVTLCSASFIANQYYFIDDYPPELFYEDLHPPAVTLSSFLDELSLLIDPYIKYEVRKYDLNELTSVPGWLEINPPVEYSDTRFIKTKPINFEENKRIRTDFSPKFRIMITLKEYKHRTINFR
ncbi:MAG: DUF6615 family protein [Cyanobacteria bacterium J06649_11]